MILQAGPVTLRVKCESGASHEWVVPSEMRTAIDGTRWATKAPRPSMDFQLTFDVSRPDDHATLLALVYGEFGPGPFRLLDATGAATNALPADVSLLGHMVDAGVGSVSGPHKLEGGGYAGRHLVNPPSPVSITQGAGRAAIAPVAGESVTVSVFAYGTSGSVSVAPAWFTSTGGQVIGSYRSVSTPSGSFLSRVFATAVVPASVAPGGVPGEVHRVGLAVQGATRLARPAVSHTSGVTEWGVGAGVRTVRLHPPSAETILALTDPKGLRASRVTIGASEVGPA